MTDIKNEISEIFEYAEDDWRLQRGVRDGGMGKNNVDYLYGGDFEGSLDEKPNNGKIDMEAHMAIKNNARLYKEARAKAKEIADEHGFVIEDGILTWYVGGGREVVVPEGVTRMVPEVFKGAMAEYIYLPDTLEEIPKGAFMDCIKLLHITVPASVKVIGREAFLRCRALKTISLPQGLKEIQDSTFDDCRNLVEISIPDSVEHIGTRAFSGCAKLKEVVIPQGVHTLGKNAFLCCSELERAELPASVNELGQGVFEYCKVLNNVTIPDGVEVLEKDLFRMCYGLTRVNLPNSIVAIGTDALWSAGQLGVHIDLETPRAITENVAAILGAKHLDCTPEELATGLYVQEGSSWSSLLTVNLHEGNTAKVLEILLNKPKTGREIEDRIAYLSIAFYFSLKAELQEKALERLSTGNRQNFMMIMRAAIMEDHIFAGKHLDQLGLDEINDLLHIALEEECRNVTPMLMNRKNAIISKEQTLAPLDEFEI